MKAFSKTFGLLLVCLLIALFVTKVMRGGSTENSTNNVQTSPSVAPPAKTDEIQWNDKTYAYVVFSVSPQEKISLIPNFSEKLTSTQIASKYSCVKGINGGFYDTTSLPLGGFKTNNSVYKQPVRNRLIDGYLWYKNSQAYITLTEPPEDAQFYLQTGPLLMSGGGVTKISIGNDEYRRRSIAFLSEGKTLSFMTLFNPESVYEGPLLADVPSLLSLINNQLGLKITNVVNLDGGSASAFISKDKSLQEFSPIGSFFCIQ